MKKILNFLKKRWYIILILILAVGIYFNQSKQTAAVKKKESFYEIKRQDIKDTLSLSGEIAADEKIVLRFQSSGRLSWVGVKEGDQVKKYQAVASLDQRELKKKLDRYLNTYMKSRWDFEDAKSDEHPTYWNMTQPEKDAVQRIAESAQFDLNNAVIDVELQNISLQYATLISPIEGIVTRVDAPFAGVNITPTQAEIEIVNPKTIYFSATADQTDVTKLSEGKEGEIVLDAFEEDPTKGKIKFISYIPKTGETGTVYQIKMLVDNLNNLNKYRIGMTGDVDFLIKERKQVLVIPSNLVKTEKDKKYVEKQVNNQKVKTFITTTDEIDGSYIVTGGLKEGDLIYTGK